MAITQSLKQIFTPTYLAVCHQYAKTQISPSSICVDRNLADIRIVTALQRQNGITNGAVLQCAAMRRRGLNAALLDISKGMRNPLFRLEHSPGTAYIFHAGGPQIPNLLLTTLPATANAYRVAYLAWELSVPPDWPDLTPLVNEIWTTSAYSRSSLLKAGYKIPVHIVPHNIPPKPIRVRGSSRFTVMAMSDARSGFVRKNPDGAIEAFCKAFGNDQAARLILKLNGTNAASNGLGPSTLRKIERHSNIEIIDGYMDESALNRLFSEVDVFLSLHRAEGFGLPMLEAMSRGIPVVATGWSGNMQFMDDSSAALVPFNLIGMKDDPIYGHYRQATWADPDISTAAASLLRLAVDREYYDALAFRGHQRAEQLDNAWRIP